MRKSLDFGCHESGELLQIGLFFFKKEADDVEKWLRSHSIKLLMEGFYCKPNDIMGKNSGIFSKKADI